MLVSVSTESTDKILSEEDETLVAKLLVVLYLAVCPAWSCPVAVAGTGAVRKQMD